MIDRVLYQIAVFIHLLAAITWVGGTLFLVIVMVPLTRRGVDSPPQGARLLGQVGRRFRPVAWVSIVLLVVTGLFLASEHWGVSAAEFWGGSGWFIQALQAKVALVAVIIALSAAHDFILGPRVAKRLEEAQQAGAPPSDVRKARRALLWLARTNLLLTLAVLALAVMLTRGSPL